ncbi:hypothetical protein [Tautonia marina]|uniref:hypothetical protein n=1 Tax=Tautonia marina TaxID=2653855 RepID=UPI001260826D|nr:hypothetical protein [Tautonia marina]
MAPSKNTHLRILTGDELPEQPAPDNDDWEAKPDWMTPAELMQIIRREREVMRDEMREDPALITCPKHRHFRESLDGLEAFTRWHWFRKG